MGQKDRCAVFGCKNDSLFPEKYTLKFPFCPKSKPKYCVSAPAGHPIILLKSSKFNMAASVKGSLSRDQPHTTHAPRDSGYIWRYIWRTLTSQNFFA